MFGFSRCLARFILVGPLGLGGLALADGVLGIDVFTVRDQRITGVGDANLQWATVQVYEIDGLEHLEAALSKDLPRDAEAAKAESLRRIGELNDARMAPARLAAKGLARALHHGVDRYPAIVIDDMAVIYGVTDLVDAQQHYYAWREARSR